MSRAACQDGPQRGQGEEYLDTLAGDIQWRGQFARTFGNPSRRKRRCGSESNGEWQRRFGRANEFCGVTKPSCRNGAAPGRSGVVCRSVAWVFWGKPVFRLTASSQLAESLARGRGNFSATERAHKRNVGQVKVECRLPGLVTGSHETKIRKRC